MSKNNGENLVNQAELRWNESVALPGALHDELATRIQAESPVFSEERKLLDAVKGLLDRDGIKTTLKDEPVVATRTSCPITVVHPTSNKNLKLFARPMVSGSGIDGKKYAIAFDEDPDLDIDTVYPEAFRFYENPETGMVDLPSGIIAGKALKPAEMLTLGQDVVRVITRQLDNDDADKAHRTDMTRRKFLHIAGWSAAGLLGAAAAGGLITYGIKSGFFDSAEKYYDKQGYELPIGETAGIGETINPDFDLTLAETPADKDINNAPELNDTTTTDPDDSDFTVNDGIREVVFESSKPGKNIVEVPLQTIPPSDARVAAWTGLRTPEGMPRNLEFNVTFLTDKIRVEWTGQERDSGDDPSVFFRMIQG